MTPEQYARAKRASFEALSIEPENRRTFILRECVDDKLVADEVLSLLASHEENPVPGDTLSGRSLSIVRSTASLIRTRWSAQSQKMSVRIGMILAVIALILGLGLWTHSEVQRVIRVATAEQLRGSLDATVAAFEMWSENKLEIAERIGNQESVRKAILEAVATGRGDLPMGEQSPEELRAAALLKPLAATAGFYSFGTFDRDFSLRVVSIPSYAGSKILAGTPWIGSLIDLFLGKRAFILPHMHGSALQDAASKNLEKVNIVQFAVPIKDDAGKVVAALVFSMETAKEFQRLLSEGHAGNSFEMYAFDRDANMLSESRFEDQLREMGLLKPEQNAFQTIKLRDPSAEIEGEAPLTHLAQAALSAQKALRGRIGGTLSQPYPDYRGVPVVGAWRWLPAFHMGFAAEADVSEISLPLGYLKISFAILLFLLGAALVSTLYSAASMVKLKREISQRKKIGNYRLIKKLGEGGIGEVYLARHDLICRPTAIKILKAEIADAETIASFEREVQLTCRLTQPNTVTIYDFGRTTDGTFYYVMEYLRGVDLGRLLHSEGRLPYGRIVHLLIQACRSLADAHENGLIHRDIKPQNIMVSKLGSETDFVKVVDFGLVKDVEELDTNAASKTKVIRGTPLYTAPERFKEPSQVSSVKVDIYAVGATAYKMCSGRNLFSAATELALINEILSTEPLPLEKVCPDCPAELARLIMRCVARNPADRPDSMHELLQEFSRLQTQGLVLWSADESNAWWDRHSELLIDASVLYDA